jgi:prealbumin domain-containing protein
MFAATLKNRSRSIALALLVLLSGGSSFACASYTLFAQVNRSSPFVVQILDFRGHPLPDAKFLLLTLDDQPIERFATNATGNFTIKGLAPGDYKIERTDEESPLRWVDLHVNDNDKKNTDPLVLQWFRGHVYTQNLAGTLRFFKFEAVAEPSPAQPDNNAPLIDIAHLQRIKKGAVADVQLELFQAGTNKRIAKTKTSNDGDFDFRVQKPGLYEMRFRFDNKESSKVLELDRDSTSAPDLDLWLNDNGYVLNGFVSVIRGCE